MLVPLKWINDYVKVDDIDPNVFADKLTMSGSNVEEVIEAGKEIKNVVAGRVISIEKHPDAEKLVICQVDVGNETIQIVTGADNMKEGDTVPVALHGSTLPGGVKIRRGKLRGVASNGMMCSSLELGISSKDDVHGILILPQDTPIGEDIKKVLGIESAVVDFEITSNRPDCLSMIGMAREAAATFNRKLNVEKPIVKENNEDIKDYIDVSIEDEDLCSRYAARVVKNIKIKDSPEWMKDRLLEAGVRPINNVVDITNYVMLEYGQPLHAFDYKKIEGNKIIVRRAKEGEKLTTLDDKERVLDTSTLVIADSKKALVVAGVMGGEDSEVSDDTNTVLLESANFNGTAVRIASKKIGLRTEASSRFEKGLDPNSVIDALDRAACLMAELCDGEVVKGTLDRYVKELKPWTIDIDVEHINKFLGTDIDYSTMVDILKRLYVDVYDDNGLKALIPTFRGDLELEVDIAEEIARIYGDSNIKSTMIYGETTQGGKNINQVIEDRTKDILVGAGLCEAITYSFMGKKDFDLIGVPIGSSIRNAVTILNPLGEDMSIMRTTMISSTLNVLATNYSRKVEEAKIFEIGKVYLPQGDKDKQPIEKNMLSIGMYGDLDFFDVKGVIELLFNNLGIRKYVFEREKDNKTFHPGIAAKILIKNKEVGVIGQVHPTVIEKYDLPSKVILCEVDFDDVVSNSDLNKEFKQLPKYPAIERDMALFVSKDTMVSEIEGIIRKLGGNLIEKVKLFDVYTGEQVPEGQKSVAYSLVYRSKDRTLKDEEVSRVHESIVKEIETKLGGKLRL